MVSELAREDIERMIQDGVQPTVDEIIKLNALGLKIKYHPESSLATLPRCAIVEDLILRQPTVGQQIFLDECMQRFKNNDNTYLAICVWVLGHSAEDIKENLLIAPKPFLKDVKNWLKDNFRHTTADQLEIVVTYLIYGVDATSCEYPIYVTDDQDNNWDRVGEDKSWALNDYLNAVAIGIDSVTALRVLSPTLAAMIERAYVIKGGELTDKEKQYTKDYYVTLDQIKKRHANLKTDN